MAHDRERNFEKALAQSLRSTGAGPAGTREGCADPELLAAYHERSLAVEECSSLKKHITGCERCQQILAQLEATESITLAAQEPTSETVLSTRTAPTALTAAAPIYKPRWNAPWRWLAPAGA